MKTISTDDIRLQELPFSFEGRDYKLRCTMNVVADVQNQCGGDLNSLLNGSTSMIEFTCIWLAAMMNNYAERAGWNDFTKYTARDIGNALTPAQSQMTAVAELVRSAMFIPKDNQSTAQSEDQEKN